MAKIVVETKFYGFRQNNSGGSFDINDKTGIGPHVWIEAINVADAISRAGSIGIYFEGVRSGQDCACCGDRWSTPWSDDGAAEPELDPNYDFGWHDTVYVHRFDGSIERVKKSDAAA